MPGGSLFTPSHTVYFKQAIKTGIAGIACVYAAKALKLPEGYWAAISAVIIMQSNVGATLGISWNRLVGTAIGAIVSGIAYSFGGTNVLVFGLAVTIAILLCDALGFVESQRFAAVTVAIVMLISRIAPAWMVAVYRFVEVSLGIVTGTLVTVLIWPSRARTQLREGISEALADLDALFLAVVQRYRGKQGPDMQELRSRLDALFLRNEALQKQAAREPTIGLERRELLALLMNHLRRLFEATDAADVATCGSAGDTYYKNLEPRLDELVVEISKALRQLGETVKAGRTDDQWFDLSQKVSALDEEAAAIRRTGATTQYSLDEILRFYSLLLALKNLASELDRAHATVMRLLPGKSDQASAAAGNPSPAG
jgi:uncharacterized membrane protein YgaE (UPF0421/DUF939 family)